MIQLAENKIPNTVDYDIKALLRPDTSVFVSANAGAGKTRQLTNRVLSLLLHGILPSRILCLTYTKAAATEMSNRVLEKLGEWVMADHDTLTRSLSELMPEPIPNHITERARGLFATVLESPEGIRFQTLHSFSQSLLRRFPLEANVSPHFSIMDDSTQKELLKEASLRLFSAAQTEDLKLKHSLEQVAQGTSEHGIQQLLDHIIKHKAHFESLFKSPGGIEVAITRIYQQLKLKQEDTLESLIERHFAYDEERRVRLRHITDLLMQGKATDIGTGKGLAIWLEQTDTAGRAKQIDAYLNSFLTQKGELRKRLSTNGVLTETDSAILQEEQQRAGVFTESYTSLNIASNTVHMLTIAHALMGFYDGLKDAQVQMDYDDLILTTRNLLRNPGISPWILFKLDGGVDHVLIDEAQDTSPIQWEIVRALTSDFFDGQGRSENDRSLFVVGDEKQSIFSFQGADPIGLGRMQQYFEKKIRDAGMKAQRSSLLKSYRSTQEVLSAVDAIFAHENTLRGLTFDGSSLEHILHRDPLKNPGLVELWPIIKKDSGDDRSPDEETDDNNTSDNDSDNTPNASKLAWRIADQIKYWLDNGLWLESQKRCAHAGDMMILVRSRTELVDKLVSALKRRNVPVAGLDRMKLGKNLAIEDLIALGNCLLLPEDDLTLAALLKSPIFNFSEDDLYQLAWGRKNASLWQRLREKKEVPVYQEAHALLTDLQSKADFISPYELYSYLLDSLGARRRIIGRMGNEYHDPIDEFLGQALLYERSHVPSLQGFMHWLASSETEIKRDMEQATNTVRILTIHASKGLQAPIVIMPDTKAPKPHNDPLLWHEEEHEAPLPFWPRGGRDSYCRQLHQQCTQANAHEYRRLLYVALTRAEDQLYICGHYHHKKINEQSWYHYIEQGLSGIATPYDTPWGTEGLRLGAPPVFKPELTIHQTGKESSPSHHAGLPARFDFLNQLPPREPTPPKPLVPSRMKEDEPASASPLDDNGMLYQRGTLIHRLLQYLPDIAREKRMQAAQNIASVYKHGLSETVRTHCIDEVMRIITHEPFAFLFAEGSTAEAPIAGCADIGGKEVAIAGQIDRLHVGKNDVWVVDFKSGRNVPQNDPDNNQEIPAHYVRQLRLYQLLLQRLYPEKQVHCGILWTAAPKLTPLPQALLDEVDLSTYI
jgi:ATP-dependent helicase/nuclease subunit A